MSSCGDRPRKLKELALKKERNKEINKEQKILKKTLAVKHKTAGNYFPGRSNRTCICNFFSLKYLYCKMELLHYTDFTVKQKEPRSRPSIQLVFWGQGLD